MLINQCRGLISGLISLLFFSFNSLSFATDKKLLHFGQDMPTPEYIATQIDGMQKTPFRGVVFRVPMKGADGKETYLHKLIWSDIPVNQKEIEAQQKILNGIKFGRLTDNFTRINFEPGTVDWFDDKGFKTVLHNMQAVAVFAKQSPNCVGILLDTEPYNKDELVLTYRTRPHTTDSKDPAYRSLETYKAKVKERGVQIIKALQSGFPDLKILVSHGWEKVSRKEDPTTKVGKLLPALLDGMLVGATGKTIIIDGYEKSYGFRTTSEFDAGFKDMTITNLTRTSEPELYKERVQTAFALAADWPHKPGTFHATNTEKNHFQPHQFKEAVHFALERTGEYVWLYGYNETGAWFGIGNRPVTLPDAYRKAVIEAAGKYEENK